jgi:hypothetical protein
MLLHVCTSQVLAWEIPRTAGMNGMSVGAVWLRLWGAEGLNSHGLLSRCGDGDALEHSERRRVTRLLRMA